MSSEFVLRSATDDTLLLVIVDRLTALVLQRHGFPKERLTHSFPTGKLGKSIRHAVHCKV